MAAPTINPEQLKQTIGETLSPDPNVRKAAETSLEQAQQTPGYASLVLQLVASSDGIDPNVRQAAAVHFKNTVKKGWDAEDAKENGIIISEADRQAIKTHLVELMCTTPTNIQAQLSESISLIANFDYPEQWEGLLPQLVQQFNSTDHRVVNGVLKTAHSIFKRFRYVERNDALYKVIIYTLEGVQEPLLSLLKQTSQVVNTMQNDKTQLEPRFETLRLIFRMAFSLVYQDLPEHFEDHMAAWMEEMHKYLLPNIFPVLVDATEEDEPSPLDKVQAAIIELLRHFAAKDEEVFNENYLGNTTKAVWQLLLSVSKLPKQDILATTSIRFLTELVSKPMHAQLFQDENTLREIAVNIVIPNLYFREADEMRFEDDPHEFMVTEVEGSDSETRRACSQSMLKAMCRQFEPATTISIQHVQSMIKEDANGANWKAKDAAINLMMGVAIKAETFRGVTQINPAAGVLEFFQGQVLPELQDGNHMNRPVVKATSIKFVATFRNQFTQEHLKQLVPLLIQHLNSPVVVVHTFAAYSIERILTCKEENGTSKFGKNELQPFLEPLFTGLFAIIENKEWNENFYAIKATTRALATIGQDVLPVTQICIEKLTTTLGRIAPNPRNPQFNHYLFESIAVLIRNVCSVDPTKTETFEGLLFPPFQTVLQMEVEEFSPYVFQILAQLLEYRPMEAGLSEAYQGLFLPITYSTVWVKGKIPALARLMQAYLRQAGPSLVSQLKPVLGIFQKLYATRATEEHAFMVLNAVISYIPMESLEPYLPEIFRLVFERLRSSRTPRYVSQVTLFFSVFISKYGGERLIAIIENIQKDMTPQIVKNIWAANLVSNSPGQTTLAKTHVMGLTKLLCETSVFLTNPGWDDGWAAGIVVAMKIVASPTFKDSGVTANLADDDVVEISFDSQFSQLQFARRPMDDPFAEVQDPVAAFKECLTRLSSKHPGRAMPLIQNAVGADEKLQAAVQSLLQSGINLA